MEIKNKVSYVANGIMGYTAAMINTHYVDEIDLLKYVRKLCKERINMLEANDRLRNK